MEEGEEGEEGKGRRSRHFSVFRGCGGIKPAAPESAYPRKKNSGYTRTRSEASRRRWTRVGVRAHGKTIGLFVVYELRLAGIRLSLLDSGSK